MRRDARGGKERSQGMLALHLHWGWSCHGSLSVLFLLVPPLHHTKVIDDTDNLSYSVSTMSPEVTPPVHTSIMPLPVHTSTMPPAHTLIMPPVHTFLGLPAQISIFNDLSHPDFTY